MLNIWFENYLYIALTQFCPFYASENLSFCKKIV